MLTNGQMDPGGSQTASRRCKQSSFRQQAGYKGLKKCRDELNLYYVGNVRPYFLQRLINGAKPAS